MDINNTYQALNGWAKDQVKLMKVELQTTENLKNNISYKIEKKIDGSLLVSFEMPEYAIFVDQGRKKGSKQPPLEPIMKWAKAKSLPTFKDGNGKSISETSRAFLIARSIAKKGIKARPFMNIPSDNSNKLTELIGASFARDLAFELQVVFNNAGIGAEK
jgi:hypothetical protein